jgi:hypothetical protein
VRGVPTLKGRRPEARKEVRTVDSELAAVPHLPGHDRFASLGPRAALAVLIALCCLMFLGFETGGTPAHAKGGSPSNDSSLFLHVLDDLRQGEAYYPAIVREQRLVGYPLRPFVTVRLPTLALVMVELPTPGSRRLLAGGLALATLSAWIWRLHGWMVRPFSFTAAIVTLCGALLPAFLGDDYTIHELWSGELIALSLAIYHPRYWGASFAIACLALSIRELTAPYFVVMGLMAWRDGRRSEAVTWAVGIAVFLGGMALHAAALHSLVRADDPTSAGWLGVVGWPFVLLLMKWNLLFMASPDWLAAVAAPMVLLGLLARRGRWEDRVTLVVAGYALGFLIFGRADNSYWGLMITPLWPCGLVASGPALASLVAKLHPAPRHTDPPPEDKAAASNGRRYVQ